MPKKKHIVLPASGGGWDIKNSTSKNICVHTKTKTEAIKIGRILSQRTGSQLILQEKKQVE